MGETATLVPRPSAGIRNIDDLRPGDLLFTRIGGFVPGVVPVAAGMLALGQRVRIGRLRFDHVAIIVEASTGVPGSPGYRPPRLVQAMPEGAEEVAMTLERHWTPETAYARLPEDWPGQAEDAAAIARLMVAAGVDYSFASYVMLALWLRGHQTPKLEARINRRLPAQPVSLRSRPTAAPTAVALPAEAICSVLVDQAWTLAGKRVMIGVPEQVVTPGELGIQLFGRRGVVWGGAGILG